MSGGVVYLDAGLTLFSGHHAELCGSVLAAFRRRGIHPRVLLCKTSWPSVVQKFQAVPQLSVVTHDWNLLQKGRSDTITGNAEKAVAQIERDLDTIHRFLRPALIYMATAQFPYIQAATRWLAGLPADKRPVVVIEIQHQLGVSLSGSYPDAKVIVPDPAVEAAPWFFAQAGAEVAAHPENPLVLFAAHPRLSWLVSQVMGCPVETLATPQAITTGRRHRGRSGRPIRIGFLGSQRSEKGYDLMVDIIQSLVNSELNIKILVQNSCPIWNCEDSSFIESEYYISTRKLMNIALARNSVQILLGYCETDMYSSLLDLVDLVVLPYNPKIFATNGSGLVAEAIANGAVTVIPANTTLDALVDATGGAGERFTEWTVESICAAIRRAVDRFETLAECAHQAALSWPETQGPDRHVDQVLAIAARYGRVPAANMAENRGRT